MKKRFLTFAVSCASVSVDAAPVSNNDRLEELVVTGRRGAQAMETLIGQVGRLSDSELEQIAHTHLQEAAVRLPSVWLSRGDGQELLAAVRSPVFTGAGNCGETLVTENGLPIRPSGLCNVNQLFETNSEQAGGLEVWRGAGTVFYGSNALHGVINVLSPVIGRNYVALEAGTDDYKRFKLGIHHQSGAHQWQLSANGNSNGSFKDESGFDQQKVSLLHRYEGDEVTVNSLLNVTNLNQETAGYVRGFEEYKTSGWNNNDNPEAYRNAQSVRLSSRVSMPLANGAEWSITPYARYSDMDFIQHYLPDQSVEENGQRSAGLNTTYSLPLSDDLKLWLGLDLEWASMSVEENQERGDIAFGASPVRFRGKHYDFEVDSQLAAVFANLEWKLGQATSIEIGTRLESLTYDYDNRMVDGSTRDDGTACATSCRYFRAADREDHFTNISGHMGFNHQLTDTWSIYGRLANAYRAPQINERYRLLDGQDVDQFEEKNLQSAELGVRFGGDSLFAEVSAYRMSKDDVILKASNNQTVGDGETRHTGVDLELGYEFNDQLSMTLAAAWAKHEILKSSPINGMSVDGNIMDTAPRWQGSAQLAYQVTKPTRVEVEWVYLDNYYLDTENTAEYEGHSLFNLRVHTQWNENWSTALRLKNIGNTQYAERADFAFGSYRYFVGERRAAFLEVKRNF